MNLDAKTYQQFAKGKEKKSPVLKNCLKAFLIGGFICCLGEAFYRWYLSMGISENTVKIMVPCTLVLLAALLTGLGWFDKIAKHAGAGTLVPITGFANAVVSPALDNKADERDIIGLSRKAP